MTDVFHKLTNFVSYNRWATLGILLGVALSAVTACQPKAADPVSGAKMTASELEASEAGFRAKLKREQDAAAAEYRLQVKVVQQTTENELEKLAAKFSVTSQERADALESTTAQFDAAHDHIAQQAEFIGSAVNVVREGLNTINPALGASLAGLFGLATVGLGLDNRRKDRKITQLRETPTT